MDGRTIWMLALRYEDGAEHTMPFATAADARRFVDLYETPLVFVWRRYCADAEALIGQAVGSGRRYWLHRTRVNADLKDEEHVARMACLFGPTQDGAA